MKRIMSAVLAVLLSLCMWWGGAVSVAAEGIPQVMYDTEDGEQEAALPASTTEAVPTVEAKAAVLMEMSGRTVLVEQNSHEPLSIASVTKVMTLLLVMEAIDDGRLALTDMVTVSERAASMGGSQIWLEENEQMTVEDMLKAAVIVSANDACAALAEHLYGTIEAFVAAMNERAKELGAMDTHFVDCSGLDDAGVSSAYDIALISCELVMEHPTITNYTTVWMDSLRNGQSELVNTNRLVRFYNGATGLKTGTTATAGCCLSATAMREGLPLCAVVLGADSSDARFAGARQLLDFGFATYALYAPSAEELACPPISVLHGVAPSVEISAPSAVGFAVKKQVLSEIEVRVEAASDVEAPVELGQTLGEVVVSTPEGELARYPLTAASAVERMDFWRALRRFWAASAVGYIL